VLILHDEISFDPGIIRIRRKGSAGGHNGLKSIIAHLGSENFPRVKIGVGKKPNPEYDLVDLRDMAEQLKGRYPQEVAALHTALEKAVVLNVTNTTGCCGVSLYYPFYNKQYYEKGWGDEYRELIVPTSYASYLASYVKKWLQNDLLQTVASSSLPSVKSQNEFELRLTNEQADAYADAKYYILVREGTQLYSRIFTSSAVTKSGNVLTADFDGNVLYAKNNFDQYWIPVTEEHDTVGNKAHKGEEGCCGIDGTAAGGYVAQRSHHHGDQSI
jgi:hypothetical protein